jgi:hypothetical protein
MHRSDEAEANQAYNSNVIYELGVINCLGRECLIGAKGVIGGGAVIQFRPPGVSLSNLRPESFITSARVGRGETVWITP